MPVTTTRTAPCLDCRAPIEQEAYEVPWAEDGLPRWRPLWCQRCDLERIDAANKRTQYFLDSEREHLRRNLTAGANLSNETAAGRRTLDSLPDLYAETRIRGGVHPERYREIAQIVKDHVSVAPLLRAGLPSILYLYGEKGTGKTWLLEAAVGYVIRELGRPAVFTSPMQIWSDIKAGFFASTRVEASQAHEAQVIAGLAGCALLAIDDIARKTTPTEWEVSTLLQVVDERYRTNRATLVNSNYSVPDLFELWSSADDPRKTKNVELLCDRLSDKRAAVQVLMSGKSLRRESK